MTKASKRQPFGKSFLLTLVMVFVEPVVGILFMYALYRVLILPAWGQVAAGLVVWTALGYGGYRLHQKMKKGLEKP
ncbi:hypothetical protein HNP33_003292 [Comamonas odontotermitis]|uniref:Uncharacterized protein n=1 Tax=Comamonas odontotermitis TaxID=379895 RepID=A0ABR6RJB5_9BURK|nr:hypothetical protein [Comamonas odontotermitis]MBB6579182.1 hypothetical protein [Comamonas odontotermitis]